jgi:hypothetical protein
VTSINFLERVDITDDEPPPPRFSLGAQLDPPPKQRNRR